MWTSLRGPLGGGQLRARIQRAVGDQREQHPLHVRAEAPGSEHAAQRAIDPQSAPEPVKQPHPAQRPRPCDIELARRARQRHSTAVAVGEARDRRRQPPQPLDVELVLAAEIQQHLGLRDATDAAVVRQLHIAHQRPVLAPPLRRPQVHAHMTTTACRCQQAPQPKSCAHAFKALGTRIWLYNKEPDPESALKCPPTAEPG